MQKTMFSQVRLKAPLAAARCSADQVSPIMILMVERAVPETTLVAVRAAAQVMEEDVQVKMNAGNKLKPC